MQLFSELSRRRVIRVAGFYAVGAWVATEVAATVLPLLQVPEKYITGIVIALIVAFPVTMILAWVYDIGPGGFEKTPELAIDLGAGRPGVWFHVSLLLISMLIFGYALFYLGQTRALQAIPRSSIAVLPFKDLSNDASKDYFSDGISEEILNLLTRVEGLSVAARTSSFALRETNDDIRTIGSKLDVETVLEGSVRWSADGDRVRITAQLIDAESGFHLWSQNFDRELKDIFQVQTEIAQAIVDNLRIELGADETNWLPPTSDTVAYDDYLRGRKLLNQRRARQIRESLDYFQRAVSRDPAFAQAYAAMAVAYVSLPIFSDEPVEQLHALADDAVQRALTLSAELAEAHAVRAWLAQYEGEWSRAGFGYFAATSMDPNDVTTRVWYSGFLLASGQLAQGQQQADRALELESQNPLTRAAVATAAMISDDNERCIEHAAIARDLGFSMFVNVLEGICLARLGRLDEASASLQALESMAENTAVSSLAAALPGADNLADAAAIAMADESEWQHGFLAFWLASAAGETDRAIARFEAEFVGHGDLQMQLLWTPESTAIRRDPRFLEIVRDSGVANTWRTDLPDLCENDASGELVCE